MATFSGTEANETWQGDNGNISHTLDGGGGLNTLDYSSLLGFIKTTASAPAPGLFSSPGWTVSKSIGLGVDTAVNFSRIIGTAGNDTFTGITAGTYAYRSTAIRGGSGNDTYYGNGYTQNAVDYTTLGGPVVVDLAAGTAFKGAYGIDTLHSVRNVRASAFNDTLLGSADTDFFAVGLAGEHHIDGRGGVDRYTFTGTTNIVVDLALGQAQKSSGVVDYLVSIEQAAGGSGNDTLLGNEGNNFLFGLEGNNYLDGREGEDWASFRTFWNTLQTTGGTIDLRFGTATNPWGGTDTLVSIEHAAGGWYNDTLTGLIRADGSPSYLRGGPGIGPG
ncbi:hypothetical protein OF850_22980 [Roseococcus sp. MDT2-1-1]|uniref:Calcium-binding protein n=2 Tax=Sabulicella glaciei TaxID=2984948 RepID=A0ABT3P207_9PROT|nr:hypothetical protein [Roseococcus sp. MDT2-1-1]